jgi:hypothetical protein
MALSEEKLCSVGCKGMYTFNAGRPKRLFRIKCTLCGEGSCQSADSCACATALVAKIGVRRQIRNFSVHK